MEFPHFHKSLFFTKRLKITNKIRLLFQKLSLRASHRIPIVYERKLKRNYIETMRFTGKSWKEYLTTHSKDTIMSMRC